MILFYFCLLANGDLQKVTIQPFDFQKEEDPRTFVQDLRLLEIFDDNLIYVSQSDPSLLFINQNRGFVNRIGKKGDGPGELGFSHPIAISIGDGSIWVLDHKLRASLYVAGEYQAGFKVKSYQIRADHHPKYSFAHNELFVVIPAFPASRALANVYDYEGNFVQRLGEIMPIDPEILQWNPAINNTIWKYRKGKWHCLMAYRPYIRIYNDQFKLEKEILIKGPEVDIFEERFHKLENPPNIHTVLPHFTDFHVNENDYYVMCYGVLYRVNHSGAVVSRTGFFANDEIGKEIGYKPRVHFNQVAITKRGRVYLGSFSEYFDHDLWYADLPK